MPYKNKDKQREFQRLHVAAKRREFFQDKKCVDCGSADGLSIPGMRSRKIKALSFSYTAETLEAVARLEGVLCRTCMIPKLRQIQRDSALSRALTEKVGNA